MKTLFTLIAPRGSGLEELADRDALLAQHKQMPLPKLAFSATVYVDGPNKNHVLLNPKELASFAESFVGMPFLKNHDRVIESVGGRILESKVVDNGGRQAIRQTIEAVKPWAIEGVLDKTIGRFSIGWDAQKYECTACGKPFFSEDHKHSPYDLGKVDKESGKVIEVLMSGLEGNETSGVTHPAVGGTGVEEQLAQMSKFFAGNKPAEEGKMIEKVLSLLGLPAETTEDVALVELGKRLAIKPYKKMAAILGFGPDDDPDETTVCGKVAGLIAPGAYVAKAEHDKVVTQLADLRADNKVREAKAAGKIAPAAETFMRKLAAEHPEAFDALMANAPVTVPVVGSVYAPNTSADPVADSPDALTEEERHVIQKMGVAPEKYLEIKKTERTRARAN